MDLEVENRRVRKSIRKRRPRHAPVGGAPYSDVSSHVDVGGCLAVNDDGIVLDIEEDVRARTAARLPASAVEAPDMTEIAYAPEGNVDRGATRICPINCNVGDDPVEAKRTRDGVIDTR